MTEVISSQSPLKKSSEWIVLDIGSGMDLTLFPVTYPHLYQMMFPGKQNAQDTFPPGSDLLPILISSELSLREVEV